MAQVFEMLMLILFGLSSTLAVHSTWVLPQRMRQEPSANLLMLGMISMGRSWSNALWSMRAIVFRFLSFHSSMPHPGKG